MAVLWFVERNNLEEQALIIAQIRMLQWVLDEFAAIFQEPKGLSPPRDVDNQILIKSEIDSVKVRL